MSRLFKQFREGDTGAANQLVTLFYPELRRLAASKMKGERSGHSWQPTVLVNEFYLELVKLKALAADEEGRDDMQAFFGLAAFLMKRLLIHHARPLSSRAIKVSVEDSPVLYQAQDLQVIDDLLYRLEAIDPKLRSVVEMKVFEGLSVDEIAVQLSCAPRTVARHWAFARKWLEAQLGKEP
jgi:RNA polymerase sigma factor (TIGR02999 family)